MLALNPYQQVVRDNEMKAQKTKKPKYAKQDKARRAASTTQRARRGRGDFRRGRVPSHGRHLGRFALGSSGSCGVHRRGRVVTRTIALNSGAAVGRGRRGGCAHSAISTSPTSRPSPPLSAAAARAARDHSSSALLCCTGALSGSFRFREADAVDGRGDEDQYYEGEDGDVADAAEAHAADAQVADGVHVDPREYECARQVHRGELSGMEVPLCASMRSPSRRRGSPGCFGCSGIDAC